MAGVADDITILEYTRAVRREFRLAAVITLSAALIAVAIAFVIPEKYEGVVAVVDAEQARSGGVSTTMLGQYAGLAGLAGFDLSGLTQGTSSARAVLNSRMLVEEFISRNNLLPVLFAEDWDASSGRWTTDPDKTPTRWLGAKEFLEDVLSIEEDATTGVITLTVEWDDPRVAASWANGLVALANQIVRSRDLRDAEKSVEYLKTEILRTNIVGLQQVLYSLVETEMQTIMLAKVRSDYAFSVVDPAVVPDLRSFPHRTLLVAIGTVIGGFIALLVVLVRLMIRMEQEGRQRTE